MTTRKVSSPAEVQRILRGLLAELGSPEALEHAYAEATLRQAQGLAASRPTPQAHMAAQAMGVQGGKILSLSGGDPAEVAVGSEFGSTLYRQFGPRNTRGYWLLPAANDPNTATMAAGGKALDEVVEAAVRGF